MSKTILITGSTDGIGLETAKRLREKGHNVLLHGRNPEKLEVAKSALSAMSGAGEISGYLADLSRLEDVQRLADELAENHDHLDVLINNAGVLRSPRDRTEEGLDVRFVVNLFAPYLLTKCLRPLMDGKSRVINLSSAAQAPVSLDALSGREQLSAMDAYAQSKLALTMWSQHIGKERGAREPVVIAVNPGSLLASKMVKEGFGVAGNDIGIGADILIRAALSEEFAGASGQYFDNDSGRFAAPHPDGLKKTKIEALMAVLQDLVPLKS
ncbi:SDR family NAD(P)-dependent oxidoreductase [uncultured Roseibium sp.]|uniref:SDR family NAD(P)-dependent oxidoreductase n=1 Tax=uncultured Roseibium sp. TaxID=1936171 RepID=UPI0026386676|nr:SDR family NAD(P)-dependent oxidoreductase [uncultured Roseibium sp.]